MLSFCLKYRKNTETKTQKLRRQIKEEKCLHENLQRKILKNTDLSKSKKPVHYY